VTEDEKSPVTQISNGADRTDQWDEPRVVVLLIGLCLLLEGVLIYYQAGIDQAIVASITGVFGITLLLFAWLVPYRDDEAIAAPPPAKLQGEPEPGNPPEQAIPVLSPAVHPPAGAGELLIPTPAGEGLKIGEPVTTTTQIAPEPVAKEPVAKEAVAEEPVLSWLDRLKIGLKKTRDGFIGRVRKLVFGKTTIDGDILDELETTLFEADLGVKTTQELLNLLQKKVEEDENKDPERIYKLLREQLQLRLTRFPPDLKFNPKGLTVFLVIGVNGVGKTTTIAKLARRFIKDGKKVVLAAGDTFRAAAIDQLEIWGKRVGAEVIKGQEGGDPGALVFDAIHAAKKRQADLLVIDTAGRMHVKVNLMDELKKIRKIAEKESDGGLQEILLVLDATTGQNAVQQAKLFNEALPISGIVMTKLDGTAKGGILFAVEEQISAPVKLIGVGEKMDDLMTFDPEKFLEALFEDDTGKTKKSDYKVMH